MHGFSPVMWMHKLHVRRKQGIRGGCGAEGFRDIWALMCPWLVGGKWAERRMYAPGDRVKLALYTARDFPLLAVQTAFQILRLLRGRCSLEEPRVCCVALKRRIS
jgi:hypothetical protein